MPTRPTVNKPSIPSYRKRTGYDQAIVTLVDSRTRKRRDYWLGPYDTPESRERYYRLIAEWESLGRRHPKGESRAPASALTISELVHAYYTWAKTNYRFDSLHSFRMALRVVRRYFGSTPAIEFGPNRLRLVRDRMILGEADDKRTRKPWSRTTVNHAVHRVCAMFKWAASHEMLPVSVYQQLKTVPALQRGRSAARESEPVRPVSIEFIDAVRPFLSRQVNALIDLQLLTGARGGELLRLRPIDIVMDERKGIWSVTPIDHKTAYRGHARTIVLGPKAQSVIRPFLVGRPVDACLFSPAEAEMERLEARSANRTTPLSCGNVPGSNRVDTRRQEPGDAYTPASYRRAIERACERAFPLPKGVRGEAAKEWRREHRWHPHQLRHTAATLIRREFGLEAARIALGHSSALVTDAVYAERDMEKVVEVMRKFG